MRCESIDPYWNDTEKLSVSVFAPEVAVTVKLYVFAAVAPELPVPPDPPLPVKPDPLPPPPPPQDARGMMVAAMNAASSNWFFRFVNDSPASTPAKTNATVDG